MSIPRLNQRANAGCPQKSNTICIISLLLNHFKNIIGVVITHLFTFEHFKTYSLHPNILKPESSKTITLQGVSKRTEHAYIIMYLLKLNVVIIHPSWISLIFLCLCELVPFV